METRKITRMDAAKKWVDECFSDIPYALMERAYKESFEDIEVIGPTQEYFAETKKDDYPDADEDDLYEAWRDENPEFPMWGWVFLPKESIDQDWIEENANAVSDLGFTVFSTEELGVYLGINGAGYNFHDHHWLPLYNLRGLQWHNTEES